jgi:hypothetical protein
MLSLFKSDPTKKLQKQYESLLEKAMLAQRNGDIRSCSELTYEAEKIKTEIDRLASEVD